MCGIVGYTGKRAAMPVLINGLKKLEYRGYDSAGVALANNQGILTRKQSGKVAGLDQLISDDPLHKELSASHCGIAHTRWATHGPPTTANAHPHQGPNGRIALVHNGINENHNTQRDRFLAGGNTITSETDTEVLAHHIESQ